MPVFIENIMEFFKGLAGATAHWPQYFLVPVVILCSIIGVVILVSPFVLILHFTIGRGMRKSLTADSSINRTEFVTPIVPITRSYRSTSCNSEYCPNTRRMLKDEVVKNSIQLLRKRGMSEANIREMMMNDFSLDSETIERLMN